MLMTDSIAASEGGLEACEHHASAVGGEAPRAPPRALESCLLPAMHRRSSLQEGDEVLFWAANAQNKSQVVPGVYGVCSVARAVGGAGAVLQAPFLQPARMADPAQSALCLSDASVPASRSPPPCRCSRTWTQRTASAGAGWRLTCGWRRFLRVRGAVSDLALRR